MDELQHSDVFEGEPMDMLSKEGCCSTEKRRGLESCTNYERLLPGIPDDLTLNVIAPKMSWGDCHRLGCVSRGWQNARVRLHSTETLVLVTYYNPSLCCRAMVLYSTKEGRFYKLPPFPYLGVRIPSKSQCLSVAGKIYVLGGVLGGESMPADEVYVLDLLVQRMEWKRCASMIQPRVHFGCGVFDGKIYVIGGLTSTGVYSGSEVYDPKRNTWFSVKGIKSSVLRGLRLEHQLAAVGTKLFTHGGKVVDPAGVTYRRWMNALYSYVSNAGIQSLGEGPSCSARNSATLEDLISKVCDVVEKADFLEVDGMVEDECPDTAQLLWWKI